MCACVCSSVIIYLFSTVISHACQHSQTYSVPCPITHTLGAGISRLLDFRDKLQKRLLGVGKDKSKDKDHDKDKHNKDKHSNGMMYT